MAPISKQRKMKLKPQLAHDREVERRAIMRPRPTYARMETDVKR